MLEIEKVLTVSTIHITKETANKIQDASDHIYIDVKGIPLCVYNKGEYGWWIHISDDTENDILEDKIVKDLIPVIKLAMKNKCKWLCLDRDADTVDEIPTYKW